VISQELKKVADFYGYEAQSNQLVEECAELIQAISKYRRAVLCKGQPTAEGIKAIALENIVEEIADVEVMLEQIKYLLQIPDEDIEAVKIFKENRTRERMSR
jgi:NTP pyrophosphatase (non-canonical NTP hydrolase)